jgi:hypothetical protein
VANQMIALQTRGAQLPDPAKATAQYANMMNMASQQRAAQLQGERTRQEMDFAKNAETRAVAGEQRNVDKFSVEQSKALVSALGTGIVKILRDPSDASIGQVGQTFTNVGLNQTQFGPLLKQIQDIPDANARKLFVMDLVAQSPEATATLKAVMPDLKESKVGNTTVFYDGNPNSANFGKPIFNITAPAEPTKMTQNVVDGTLMNTNPYTGVSAEAITGDPTQNLAPVLGAPTFSSTGVTSPYAIGGGTGQQPMTPPVTPTPPAAVGAPPPMGAPGRGKGTFKIMIGMESRGKQFDKSGAPLTSPKGAIGIAQIMPATAPEAAKLAGLPYDITRLKNDEAYNLALGEAYFEKQLRDFGGDERKAAAAYNAGPGAVRRAIAKGGPNGWINHVPRETQNYVAQIPGGGAPARTPTRPSGGAPTGSTGTPTVKPQTVSEQQRQKGFVKTLELFDYDPKTGVDSISPLIKSSTSGGLEKLGSEAVGFLTGEATSGRVALGQLKSLQASMTFTKLREKLGAQVSDADVQLVANTMGDIANADIPWNERLAMWQNVVLPILVRGAGLTPVKRGTPTGGGGSSGRGTSTKKPPLKDIFR